MNYRRIAVAVDFSEPSRHALREAGRLAERSRGELLAIHVAEEHAFHLFEKELCGDPHVFQAALDTQLRSWIAECVSREVPQRHRVCVGSPGRDLCRQAESFNADLLVAGTRGNSHPNQRLGTVSGMLIRHAAMPVLLANPEASPFRSLVVCLDYSSICIELMDHALSLAETEDLEIHAIHNEPSTLDYYATLALSSGLEPYTTSTIDQNLIQKIDNEHASALENFVTEYQERAHPRRIKHVLTQNLNNARGILGYLINTPSPLVIMGAHGRSGWREAIVGTTTERVLHSCPGSALVIRSSGKTQS